MCGNRAPQQRLRRRLAQTTMLKDLGLAPENATAVSPAPLVAWRSLACHAFDRQTMVPLDFSKHPQDGIEIALRLAPGCGRRRPLFTLTIKIAVALTDQALAAIFDQTREPPQQSGWRVGYAPPAVTRLIWSIIHLPKPEQLTCVAQRRPSVRQSRLGHLLAANGFPAGEGSRSISPAHVAQHHLGRGGSPGPEFIVLARIFGRSAVGGLQSGPPSRTCWRPAR